MGQVVLYVKDKLSCTKSKKMPVRPTYLQSFRRRMSASVHPMSFSKAFSICGPYVFFG